MALRLSLVSFRIPKRRPTKENKRQNSKNTPFYISPERISSTPKGTSPKMRKRQCCLFVCLFSCCFIKVRSVEPLDVYKGKIPRLDHLSEMGDDCE
jgi:hypothetical protein